MKKLAFLSLGTVLLFANGYKIPEQSISGVALSSANIANVSNADAAFYNPANIGFFDNKNFFELDALFIHLNKVKFKNNNGDVYYSRKEDFALPTFHFASKEINGFRFGFCIVYPDGLSKRWDDVVPEAGAKEFTLKTVEFNPSIIKRINSNFSAAFGIRFVKSEGIANVLGLNQNGDGTITPLYSQYLNGSSWDRGWNAAISYQNNNRNFKISATYRSSINLSISGNGSGYYSKYLLTNNPSDINTYIYFNTPGKVTIPIPAQFDFAIAKTINKTTIEAVFERTYWSKYKKLDFDFKDPYVNAIFGKPIPKNWKDANTYRIGVTHNYTGKLTIMAGYAYDKTPVPDNTLDFSLPDSDKHIFSAGFKYKMDKKMSLGFAGLYTKQKKRKANIYDPVTKSYTKGEFSKGGAFLFAIGLNYNF